MSLVDKDDMITLRSASDSLATAQHAEEDIQLKAVAYAINEAANTGQVTVVFQGELLDGVRSELESKGYQIQNYGPAFPERRAVISWKNA